MWTFTFALVRCQSEVVKIALLMAGSITNEAELRCDRGLHHVDDMQLLGL